MGSVAVAIVDPDFCMFDGLADEIVLVILGYLQTRDRWSLSRYCLVRDWRPLYLLIL